MKKLTLIFLVLLLAGCGPELTHDQQRTVTDACHAAGMDYRVQYNQITCWTTKDPR